MAQFCLVRFDGDADKRTTFDVVNMTRVVSKEDDGPCEGSQVQVRWRDKGLFKATLIAISEDRPELIKEMDKAIADYNRQAMADPKKMEPGSGTATQLLFCWSDPDVVELQPGSSIFVEARALQAVLHSAKTSTALARGLLPAVFNKQALLTCSMKGQKAKGAHKPVAQRPPLHAAAIDAILAYTKSTAIGKGWDFSEKLLVPSMGTKLAELRAEGKKSAVLQ
ncbi:uncharacterized protein LOC119183488 [Rhipicephalus microplus]|uniref:uncharacterized protein LOC119183488 n=1 Tax=Rhipicephalus microplus TaxID=6941 RepID=UPI003F6B45E8